MTGYELVKWPDGLEYELLAETGCAVEWCRARRRHRLPPMGKYDRTVRYSYGESGDKDGTYAGLVHDVRVDACKAKAALVEVAE